MTESKAIRCSYVLRAEDMYSVTLQGEKRFRHHRLGRTTTTTWIAMILLLIAILLAINQDTPNRGLAALLVVLVPGVLWTIHYWWHYYERLARMTSAIYTRPEIPGMFGPQTLVADDTGIILENELCRSFCRWPAYTDLIVAEDHLALMRAAGLGVVVPRATLRGVGFSELATFLQSRVSGNDGFRADSGSASH